ncbi:MAG: hypothetical protein ABEH43_06175, partial [Flavobacteriales bacterium]
NSSNGFKLNDDLSLNKTKQIQGKIIIKGPHYYLLISSTNKKAAGKRFLESFRFQPYNYNTEFVTHNDTSLHLQIKMPKSEQIKNKAFNQWQTLLNKMKLSQNTGEYYKMKQKSFSYAPTSEKVKIRLYQFNNFYGKNYHSDLWNMVKENFYEKDLILENYNFPQNNDSSICHMTFRDTNSFRTIETKNIIKEGALYNIMYCSDTISKKTKFQQKLFNSFKPEDTTIGSPIFENKAQKYFKALENKDSALIAEAMNIFNYIDFDSTNITTLKNKILNEEPSNDMLYIKPKMINVLSWFDKSSEKILPFLKELYTQVGDTVSLQISILQTLARIETKNSRNVFIDLLEEEIPLSSNKYDIKSIFYDLNDSLELAKTLFPEILKYSDFKEYKYNIYDLLAKLIDKNLITVEKYSKYHQKIIKDAKIDLKRKLASEEGFQKNSNNHSYSFYSNRSHLSSSDNRLLDYATILIQLRKDSKKASEILKKLKKTSSKPFKLHYSFLRLKKGLPVEDEIWTQFSSSLAYRTKLYKQLKKLNKTNLFKENYKSQKHFAKSILYESNFNEEKDTAIYLKKNKVEVKGKKGYVYFFKSKRSSKDHWKLDHCGPFPLDEKKVQTKVKVSNRGDRIYKNSDISAMIKKEVKFLNLKERERIKKNVSPLSSYLNFHK